MTDRIPLGTRPGTLLALVGIDLPVASEAAAITVNRLVVRRDANAGGAAVVELRNATGGGGDAISASFGAGAEIASGTGSISGTDLYLRVASADALSENLSGWFELAYGSVAGTFLTTIDRVKAMLLITGASADGLLTTIVAGVSARIQSAIGRTIIETAITAEKHSREHFSPELVLRRRPVTTVDAVRVDAVALAASGYLVDDEAGILHRRYNGAARDWEIGTLHLEVDYTAGYAVIPEDLAHAATLQAAYTYQKRDSRIHERGELLDAGGSAQYLTGPWAPGVLDILAGWREARVG